MYFHIIMIVLQYLKSKPPNIIFVLSVHMFKFVPFTGYGASDSESNLVRLSKRKRKPPPAADDSPPQNLLPAWTRAAIGSVYPLNHQRR